MMNSKDIPQADQSWVAAEKMLDRHFRNKRILIWSISVLVPAIMVGLTLMLTHSNNSEAGLNHSVHSKKLAEQSAPIASTNESIQIINSGSQDLLSNASFKNENSNNNSNYSSDHSVNNGPTSNTKTNDLKTTSIVASNAKANNNSENLSQEDLNKQNGKSLDVLAASTVASVNNNGVNTSSGIFANENNTTANNSVTPLSNNNSSSNNYTKPFIERTGTNPNEEFTLMRPSRRNLQFEASTSNIRENKFPLPVVKSNYSPIVWEIGAYGGANYIHKNLSADPEWSNYLMHRQNEEEAVIAPSIGVLVTANLKSINISAGVEYAVYGEKTNYYPYSNQLKIDDNSFWQTFTTSFVDTDTAYIWGNPKFFQTVRLRNDSMFIVDQDSSEEYKYDENIAKNNGVNKLYYVEIPIEISYVLNKGKMGIGITGGISPAFLTKEKGYYIRKDGKGIESLEEIESFRKFILNARVGVDIYYRAGARTKLMLRPMFKANLNSVFQDDYGVKQKYNSTGILFGVTYILN
jgi:hypothetical protein